MTDKIYIVTSCIAGLSILGFFIYRIKKIFDLFNAIINDTLKRIDKNDGRLKWSATKLTMATAWFSALATYFYDCYKNGFNETAFYVLVGVALGAKVTDSWSKKIEPQKINEPA